MLIGLDSWIIQDGNYGNFKVGENYKFALEFYPELFWKTKDKEISCEALDEGLYKVNAKVIFQCKERWIIDFGLLAYTNRPIENYFVGDYIEAKITLGVDPFFYFEEINQFQGVPALIYDWHLNSIQLETTPWVTSKDDQGHELWSREKVKRSFPFFQR
jgi:hypothetical protein